MKKQGAVTLGLVLLSGLAAVSLAQQNANPSPAQHKTFVGVVNSIVAADNDAGKPGVIVLIAKANAKMIFLLRLGTLWLDAKGGATAADKVKKGDKVTVAYLTTPKGHEAVSVKLMR